MSTRHCHGRSGGEQSQFGRGGGSRIAGALQARLEIRIADWYDKSSYLGVPMPSDKIAVTIDQDLLTRLDGLVKEERFPNRSRAVQVALRDKLERIDRGRLARECAKLDPTYEQHLAEECLSGCRNEIVGWTS
jgi:Arc/MetJ-type ribon-helix-helix transcriptional regulator